MALNEVRRPSARSAQAAAVANKFDLVIVRSDQQSLVTAMEAANPRLATLVDHNGALAQSNEGSKYPEAWYARDV